MKKLSIIVMMLLWSVANAQNVLHINISDVENYGTYQYCLNDYDLFVFEKEDGCNNQAQWDVMFASGSHYGEYYVQPTNELVLTSTELMEIWNTFGGWRLAITYRVQGCSITYRTFTMCFNYVPTNVNLLPQEYVWKRTGATTRLSIDDGSYVSNTSILWSTGSHSSAITVRQPGTYWVRMYNDCGSVSDTIKVYDHVELQSAGVDLATNLNKVTWVTTPEQAVYVSEVKVERDGVPVGTAPYDQGYFIDAIGSDNAARNYRITAIMPDGTECPLPSYERGTIHTTYYEDVNHNLNMTWNTPFVEEGAPSVLTRFLICRYDPWNETYEEVDRINASLNDYTCNVNTFNGYQAVIAAEFSGAKSEENLSFSNISLDIWGVGEENGGSTFSVYPNPSRGGFTIEATGTITITNILGQLVKTVEVNGFCAVELTPGTYMVRNDHGTVKRVVVVE